MTVQTLRRNDTALPRYASDAAVVVQVRTLTDRVRARAAKTEADRRVADDTIGDILDAGLFGVTVPALFGGSELGFAALVDATAELAAACGSTGWVYGVLAGHSWMLNYFPPQAQKEIFADPRALTATVFRLAGTVVPVAGGHRLTNGDGRFCSGVDFAQWVVVGGAVTREGAPPEPRFFVLPKSDVEVVDDWFTTGMRGTGSRSIRIKDAFIPEHRSVATRDIFSGNAPGTQLLTAPRYRIPFQNVAPFSLVGVPLGLGRAALRSFCGGMKQRVGNFTELQLAEQSATFARIAEAASDIEAAHAMVLEDARRIDGLADPKDMDDTAWSRVPRDWAYAAQRCRYAVNRLFEVHGGGAIYDGNDMQRIWRDTNAASQHFAFTWDSAMTSYGRALLGLTASKFGPKGRA